MSYRIEVFKKASLCRNFELLTSKYITSGDIYIPTYTSTGQEFISSSLSVLCKIKKIKPLLFGQHRCHSIYLSFEGKIELLIDELLGLSSGINHGFSGSASIGNKSINMYGHDGLMGSNGPIGVGACYASKKPTIIFLGDAAVEEDYVLGAMGWASKKNLPLIFIIEDNNFSISTEKLVRRNWEIKDVARSFKIRSYDINDCPIEIKSKSKYFFKEPLLLNIFTNRINEHRGGNKLKTEKKDRYLVEKNKIGVAADKIDYTFKKMIERIWLKRLEKQ
jgi:TPP-dependent pyruvate/acetoin dehydrogenase alpha subunit